MMGFISAMRGVIDRMFSREEITKKFGITTDMSSEMYSALQKWDSLFVRSKTKMPSVIAGEASRLATVDMQITFNGGERANYLQWVFDQNRDRLRTKLELGCAYGGLILKPTATGIDFIPATRYIPIEYDNNGNLVGVIFIDTFVKGRDYYTRLEYNRFEVDDFGQHVYVVTNKAYKSSNKLSLGNEIELSKVPKWSMLQRDTNIYNLDRPLFGYFRMPIANNIDVDSPLGVSIFSKAVESLNDFDDMYAKWKREFKLGDKILFVDEQAMTKPGGNGSSRAQAVNPFPELIKGLKFGNNATKCIEEYNPDIRVEKFKQMMQTQLDLISVQCGFSAGYFSFDARTGSVTATQIESEDQRTLSTCTDIQLNFKQAIEGLVYALDVYLTLYNTVADDAFDVSYYMRDLFVNVSEDRTRAFQLAQSGYIPKWKYLVDYEGYSEEEAKRMVEEASDGETVNP